MLARSLRSYEAKNRRNVLWNEQLRVVMTRDDLEEGIGLFVNLVDFSSKKYLSRCIVPADELLVGDTYNLALVLNDEGSCLLLSVTPEPHPTEEVALFAANPELMHLEVTLKVRK
jgi:hypothetical protein